MRSSVLDCGDALLTTAPTLAEFLKKAGSGSVGTPLSALLRRKGYSQRQEPVVGGSAGYADAD